MTEIKVDDDGGDTMTCILHNDHIFPVFNTRAITGLTSVKIREDDVLILGYPKSGNHWLWELTRQVLRGRVVEDDVVMNEMMMECAPEEKYADLPSPRILASNAPLSKLSPAIIQKKPKMITIYRNPKDVMASYYPFMTKLPFMKYTGKWENFVKPCALGKFCHGSWIDHVLSWEKVKKTYPEWPILTVFYEDLKEDPVEQLRRLCSFLDVKRSDEFLEEVVNICSFSKMKDIKSHSAVFRKGEVGDWKNCFTVAQSEWFDQLYQEKMSDCPLQFRYTL
ncbi:sulfotransferase 1B1-like [Haliotis rubra]|uniref:sulfotransferase 1B1-like n=1 Tax=Haliotis rubra TaxID=36100 RepID=UPI001EE533DD|nr:sulfotransferase 1B1-like [Haliotis rubra]XP_046569960.1 sulfotransferase 1B1-like [Haliotis rubra]